MHRSMDAGDDVVGCAASEDETESIIERFLAVFVAGR